jgi:uncharacterized membrane protein
MLFLSVLAVLSHVSGIYNNRQKPMMMLLGLCSLVCVVTVICLLEKLAGHGLDTMQRWVLVKHFSYVCLAIVVILTIRLHMVVPWWYAVVAWLLCINTVALGVVVVILIEQHIEEVIRQSRVLPTP